MREDEAVAFQRDYCLPPTNSTTASLTAAWNEARARIQPLRGTLDPDLRPLSQDGQRVAGEISGAPNFTLVFGNAPLIFASLKVDGLLAVQKFVDCNFTDELAAPDSTNEGEVLRFCMRANPIDIPMVGQDGQVTFSSPYSQNLVPASLTFNQISESEIQVIATIISRPNYMQVAQIGNMFVLTNGYHRAVALKKAGHERIPCIVRGYADLNAAGLPPPGFFDMGHLSSPRPPLVADLIEPTSLARLEVRAKNHILRVGLQVGQFDAPR